MSLKQVRGCKHLHCSDCGTVEDIGYWIKQPHEDGGQQSVFVEETMKAAAKRHVKEKHMGQSWHKEEGKTLDELTAEMCYVQQCIDWEVVE
jgi:hypothetical protein